MFTFSRLFVYMDFFLRRTAFSLHSGDFFLEIDYLPNLTDSSGGSFQRREVVNKTVLLWPVCAQSMQYAP